MDRLWTPWRLNYVSGENKSNLPPPLAAATECIFCDKPRENDDVRNLILFRGDTCYAILNAYPYNNGHLMVVPFRHVSRPRELSADENAELMQAASALTSVLDGIYRPDGYNIGMNVGSAAGAGIASHLHLHLVPRWSGDTNFMPVLADVKVLPELLEQTYQKIRAAWEAERAATE